MLERAGAESPGVILLLCLQSDGERVCSSLGYFHTTQKAFRSSPAKTARQTHKGIQKLFQREKLNFLLTYKIDWFIQPRQNFLTKAVVHRHSQEMGFWNKIRLWTSIAGVQYVANIVLLHQLLGKRQRLSPEESGGTSGTLHSWKPNWTPRWNCSSCIRGIHSSVKKTTPQLVTLQTTFNETSSVSK